MKLHLRHPELWMKTSSGYKTSMETWAQGIVGNKASAWQIPFLLLEWIIVGWNFESMNQKARKKKDEWHRVRIFFKKANTLRYEILSHMGIFFVWIMLYIFFFFFFLHRSPSFHVHQSRTVKDDLHALEFWLLFTSDTHFSLLYYRFIFANPWCLVPNHSS